MHWVWATVLVGTLWVAWHVPLFFIPGVVQFHMNFVVFATETFAMAFLLAWLYGGTRSILLCVLFHAASNTSGAMGLGIPEGHTIAALLAAVVKLLGAVALLIVARRRASAIQVLQR